VSVPLGLSSPPVSPPRSPALRRLRDSARKRGGEGADSLFTQSPTGFTDPVGSLFLLGGAVSMSGGVVI
jgi:hypothetical protein